MVGQLQAAEPILDNDAKKLSYTLLYQMAQNLARQGMAVDADAASRAVHDVFSGKQPLLTAQEMQDAVKRMQVVAIEKRKQIADENKITGEKFLAENKDKEGVKSLPSGLQYKVLTEGVGKTPKPGDKVVAHYEGRLVSGKVFDSSIKRGSPATFPVTGVIKGWQEALQLMKEGAKWQVYIPPQLAYGKKGFGASIGPNATLIFDIELIKII